MLDHVLESGLKPKKLENDFVSQLLGGPCGKFGRVIFFVSSKRT